MTHKFAVPKAPPPGPNPQTAEAASSQKAEEQDEEWDWQDLQQQAPRTKWWDHMPKEEWDAVKEEMPPEDDTIPSRLRQSRPHAPGWVGTKSGLGK